MKIRIMSDLHLCLERGSNIYYPTIQDDDFNTTLILAGDVANFDFFSEVRFKHFLTHISENFKEVLWVLGNHEHYKSNISTTLLEIERVIIEMDIKNVHLLNNTIHQIDDVYFIGTTMWSDLRESKQLDRRTIREIENSMNDYRVIRNGDGDILSSEDTSNIFVKSYRFIKKSLKDLEGKKCVVITHHAPHISSIPVKYIGSVINRAYYTDCTSTMKKYKPLLWIHGHTHSFNSYFIHDTEVICNPRGYHNHNYDENTSYNEFLYRTI